MTTEPILQFFDFAHLPEHLGAVSEPFHDLTHSIVDGLPRNPERTVALRKLLEAKDAAVRAMVYEADVSREPERFPVPESCTEVLIVEGTMKANHVIEQKTIMGFRK